MGDELYENVNEITSESGDFAIFFRIGGVICSSRNYYRLANRFFAPLVFPVMELEVIENGDKGFRMVSTFPPDAPISEVFWKISQSLMIDDRQ